MADYTFNRTLDASLAEAKELVTPALKAEGFGILTEIDIKATIKEKLDEDVAPYTILGACNPGLAHKAMQAEPRIGAMLPCNVILREVAPGKTEVSAIDPVASMASVENDALAGVATEVRDRLRRVVDSLG